MNEHLQTAAAPLDTAPLLFDPQSPDYIKDPYPFYERLRTLDPVHLTPLGNYLVSRHAEVSLVLRDKRFGKDFAGRISRRYGAQVMDEPVFQSMGNSMMQQDPPDHTRLRGLVIQTFTARRVEDMRPRIQQIVDDALDRVENLGHMDLIRDFAFRLPMTVILDLLGIPTDQRERFYRPSHDSGRLLEPVPLSRAEIDKANAANLSGRGYFLQLCEFRRKQPGDDLITHLVQAEAEGAKLSNGELTSNIMMLFGAGHETTVNLIGNGLLALFRHPDQLALLKANPALITNAVEEFLRYDSSVQLARRVALEDVDDLGGKPIPKGESVLCLLGSANRDPAVYPDRPDRLDITRPNVRPLSFGGGIHFCLGAQLARAEAEIAIATLLRRLPGIRPDDLDNPKWRPTFVLRGLRELPASW
jgi:cytochrome P450